MAATPARADGISAGAEAAAAGSGPVLAERLLEDLRVQLFEGGAGGLIAGDPRAQLVYERIAEQLQEPDEGDPLATQRGATPAGCGGSAEEGESAPMAAAACWAAYVQRSLASIERRAHLVDELGRPRVTFEHLGGALRHVDLADWHGRLRARAVYAASGEPVEIRLTNLTGEEVVYTRETFGAAALIGNALATGSAGSGTSGFAATVAELVERARRSTALLAQDASLQQARLARRNAQAVCDEVLPLVERLLRRELEEGRQLVPTSEDLLEMSFEQILEHLARAQ